MKSLFWATLQRELTLHSRHIGELLKPLVFFTVILSLFPLALNPSPTFLATLAPGITWITLLLTLLLSLDRLFAHDHDNGTLEQIFTNAPSALTVIYAKLFAFYVIYTLPLILFSPILAIALHLPTPLLPSLIGSLLLGAPTICLLASLGAALTLGTPYQHLLLALILLPLSVPILIFGSHCTWLASLGEPITGLLCFLAAFFVLCLTLLPLAICAALRYTLANS